MLRSRCLRVAAEAKLRLEMGTFQSFDGRANSLRRRHDRSSPHASSRRRKDRLALRKIGVQPRQSLRLRRVVPHVSRLRRRRQDAHERAAQTPISRVPDGRDDCRSRLPAERLIGSHCRYEIASQSPFRVEKTKSPRGLVNFWGISSLGDGKGITPRVPTGATAQKGRADYGCGIAAPAGISQIPPTTMASSAAPVSSIR